MRETYKICGGLRTTALAELVGTPVRDRDGPLHPLRIGFQIMECILLEMEYGVSGTGYRMGCPLADLVSTLVREHDI